jgi:hypothetical protein
MAPPRGDGGSVSHYWAPFRLLASLSRLPGRKVISGLSVVSSTLVRSMSSGLIPLAFAHRGSHKTCDKQLGVALRHGRESHAGRLP